MHLVDDADDRDVADQQHDHHLRHVDLLRPDLRRHVDELRHRDRIGERRRLDEIDEIVGHRRHRDAHARAAARPCGRSARGNTRATAAASTIAFGTASMPARKISAANAVSSSVSDTTAQPNDPEERHAVDLRQHRADGEVEEIELDQRRRVAEELRRSRTTAPRTAATREPAATRRPRPQREAQHEAIRRQLERGEEALDERARS